MLSKEKFVEYISFIQKQETLQNDLCNVLESLSPGNYCNAFIYAEYSEMFIDAIVHALFPDLKDDLKEYVKEDLYFFICDLAFGTVEQPIQIDDKKYIITNAAELYNYLMKTYCII